MGHPHKERLSSGHSQRISKSSKAAAETKARWTFRAAITVWEAAGRHRQVQHGPDALAGALGGVAGALAAEQGGGVLLALRQDALRLVEGVRPVDFRDVPGLAAQKAAALVAGHVQPGRARLGVALDKVRLPVCSLAGLLGGLHHDGALNALAEQLAARLVDASDGAGGVVGVGRAARRSSTAWPSSRRSRAGRRRCRRGTPPARAVLVTPFHTSPSL